MSLRAGLSEYQAAFQGELFPALEEALGPLPERSGRFVQVLEFVLVAAIVLPAWPGGAGSPAASPPTIRQRSATPRESRPFGCWPRPGGRSDDMERCVMQARLVVSCGPQLEAR